MAVVYDKTSHLNINILPKELISLIISYIHHEYFILPYVCKFWRELYISNEKTQQRIKYETNKTQTWVHTTMGCDLIVDNSIIMSYSQRNADGKNNHGYIHYHKYDSMGIFTVSWRGESCNHLTRHSDYIRHISMANTIRLDVIYRTKNFVCKLIANSRKNWSRYILIRNRNINKICNNLSDINLDMRDFLDYLKSDRLTLSRQLQDRVKACINIAETDIIHTL